MWTVLLHSDFSAEVAELSEEVQDALLTMIALLEQHGPSMKRPWCATLAGSKYSNMKELRFSAEDGVWRVAFAFDPRRRAVLLVGGDKSGVGQKKFYKALIAKADSRFYDWMEE